MEYKVIDAHSTEKLEKAVNEHLADWEPVGGICCIYEAEGGQFYFYQAMVKRS